MAASEGREPPPLLVWATAAATPCACAFEYGFRKLVFPADFEDFRTLVRPWLTTPAWGLTVLVALSALLALPLQQKLEASFAEKERNRPADEAPLRVRTMAFVLSTSLPQLAALVATFAFTFGAPFFPVAISMVLASLAVLVQGLRALRA